MGRTFDALQRTEAAVLNGTHAPEPERPPAPEREPASEPIVALVPDLPTNAPFIEVGRQQMDASPEVLAAPLLRTYLTPPEPRRPAPSPTPSQPASGPRLQPLPGTTLRPAGVLPPEVIAYHDPAHALAREYRALTNHLLELRPGLGPRTLAFTTAYAGMPLGAVLLNVGTTAAKFAARRVVLIEADLRQPTLASLLGFPKTPGLIEVLSGIVPIEQAVRSTEQANLLILPAGEVAPDSHEQIRLEPFRQLLQRLALRADLLLLALPRWDARPDVLAVTACCDALFVVAPEAEADQPHVRQMLTQLPALGAPLAGTVLLTT